MSERDAALLRGAPATRSALLDQARLPTRSCPSCCGSAGRTAGARESSRPQRHGVRRRPRRRPAPRRPPCAGEHRRPSTRWACNEQSTTFGTHGAPADSTLFPEIMDHASQPWGPRISSACNLDCSPCASR
ncbi:hypothetical protein QJS66_06965 [Kocuria rhizophila]|nr:hypothetical protein QJS66_06965 [Kocuria rhizophila]